MGTQNISYYVEILKNHLRIDIKFPSYLAYRVKTIEGSNPDLM